ncbi:MAG TPA: rod-binding protein [Hyphomicrobiaceae bacterium]|nr:rod-binding protein [Hyphomicrobiaceae bacterium]
MAINPPGDIILGVARAADPLKYQAAKERLTRIGGEAATQADPRVRLPTAETSNYSPPARATQVLQGASPAAAGRAPRPLPGAADALSQFEAFVLQTFVQAMLPKHADGVFGRGLAGEVWKSMMAEVLAKELAESGRAGIAKQIAGRTSVPSPVDPASALHNTLAYLAIAPTDRS